MITLNLGCYGIVVEIDEKNPKACTIVSDLKECFQCPEIGQEPVGDASADALESIILAHACAEIDIKSPEYIAGIETAVEKIANNL